MSTKLCSVESRLRYHGLGATLLPGVGEPSRLSVTPKGEPRMPPRRVAFSDSRIEQPTWEGTGQACFRRRRSRRTSQSLLFKGV